MSCVKGSVVGRQSDTAEACIRSQAGIYEMCGETGGNGTGLSLITSVLPCQYHCNHVPYSVSS
jgi:hypothetical protein